MADTGSTTTPTATKVQPICSFWGRLLALGVDLVLLFVVGSLLGIQVQYGYEIGIAPRAYVQVERRWGLFHGIWREKVGAGVDYF